VARQLSDRQLLIGHLVLTALLSGALLILGDHSSVMILLIGPAIYAAFVASRRIYLPMIAISSLAAALVIFQISTDIPTSLVTLTLLTVLQLLVAETVFQQNALRAMLKAQAELHSAVFISLGKELNEAASPREAAQVVVAAADRLLGWDCCVFELYRAEDDSVETMLLIDIIDGERRDFAPGSGDRRPTPLMRRAITEGAFQIDGDSEPIRDAPLFGTGRRSASLMFVPIRSGAQLTGMLSIQSYTPNAYSSQDLETLQALADYCGGRLERLRVELAVREQEARYRAITELTSDYIFAGVIAPGGAQRTEWLTEGALTRITGLTAAEFSARGDWDALVHPDDRPIARRRAERLLAGHSDISELRIVVADGETRWLRVYSRPDHEGPGQGELRILGAMQDITASKQAEESLLHRQKLESLGVLAGGIAHDFNNLLTVILGNADLALAELEPGGVGAESIEQLRRAARRASELTQQMLAYSGRGRFVIGPVELNAVVSEMLGFLGSSLAKQIQLVPDLDARLPAIEGDASQINQLVLNLIVNAAEAIGEAPGTITVATAARELTLAALAGWRRYDELAPGRYVCLEVRDTGPGMDAATQARIFDPFFSTKFTGRGLGLAVVVGVVRSHHGALQVVSEPGRGTSFRVALPALRWQDEQEEGGMREAGLSDAAAPSPAGTFAGGLVLIIDDEESVRSLAARIVERAGGRALQAADGETGLALLRAHGDTLGCVLLDLSMPRLSGEQVLPAIRELRPALPVVVMSGYDTEELRSRFGAAAPVAFLQKPFRPQELYAAVEQARQG
jgi:PAS domain S-box-containing protein